MVPKEGEGRGDKSLRYWRLAGSARRNLDIAVRSWDEPLRGWTGRQPVARRETFHVHSLAMQITKPVLLFLFMILVVAAAFRASRDLPWTPLRIAGAIVAVPSLILWFAARAQLGKSFSITPQAKELVTHGLYSKIRNPVYLFGSFFIAGMFLYIGRPWLLLLFLVLIPLQLFRIKKEEKVLREKFGETYLEYKKKTWF